MTYLLAAADVGSTLTYTSTATNAGGTAESTSAPTSAVTAPPAGAFVNPDITIDTPLTNPPTFLIDLGGAVVGNWLRLRHGANAALTTGVTVETIEYTTDVALQFEAGSYDWLTVGPGAFPAGNWSVQIQVLANDATTVRGSSAIRSATLA